MLHQMPPLFHLCITPCFTLHAAGCTPSGLVKAATVKLPARPRWVAARCPFCFGGGCAAAPPRSHGLLCVGTTGAPPLVAWLRATCLRGLTVRIRTGSFALLASARQSLSPVARCLTHARSLQHGRAARGGARGRKGRAARADSCAFRTRRAGMAPARAHSGAFGATRRSA